MRNFKKFLSLMLALLMVSGMAVLTTGAAGETADYTDAAHHLAAIGILKGDGNGNLMLENGVTRYQAALFFVQSLTGKTDASVWNAEKSTVFTDVPEYGTAIDYLAGLGFILGRGNGIYGYNDPITYQDMLVLAVRALGYETDSMAYPYGYILEAQKLGLTDNIDSVNFRAAMTRGETAQLIWDMLGTELAFTDPLTGETIYPGKQDASAYGLLLGPGKIKRETYLEKAGFADGKMVVTVTGFTAAANSDDVDTVEVQYDGQAYEIAAGDLGITAKTPKIEYLGLPMTLFVNCKAENFFDGYDLDPDESDASVVFTDTDALTAVENLGNAGTIKVVTPQSGADYISLDGVKYQSDKYELEVYNFGADGWSETDSADFLANFAFDAKDGYTGDNSYGAVRYIVRETTENEETVKTLHIYYTPYEFGQYFVRTLKDSTTAKDAQFVTIGVYETAKVENKDGEKSNFVEYLLGTSAKVTSATGAISKRNGEAAKSAVLAGESVKSGDFMFYYYNSVDNIITVAENCGTFKTGQLTASNSSKETVRLGGTDKSFGFAGAYATDYSDFAANQALIKSAIEKYTKDNDNVKYILADGNIVYMEAYAGASTSAQTYDFAIVTTDADILADLMKTDADKLDYTADFVLDKDGYVVIAVLNTETGEYELAKLNTFAMDYDAEEDEYAKQGALGTYATYVEIAGSSYTKYEDYRALADELENGVLFAVTNNANGVYDLGTAEDAVDFATISAGLVFSDASPKTNAIKADSDENVAAARVTLNNGTVIVIIDEEGNVGVRVGVQKAKFSVRGEMNFYAASADLIVATVASPEFAGGFADVTAWGESRTAVSDATYYVALDTSEISLESSGEDVAEKYTVTITNLLDLRTLKVVSESKFNTSSVVSLDLSGALYASEDGVITHANKTIAEAFKAARLLAAADGNMDLVEVDASELTFTDSETAYVAGDKLDLPDALASIVANVVTIDATGLDKKDYDFTRLALNSEYSADGFGGSELEISEGFSGYEYLIEGDMVETVNEPVNGILDQFVIDTVGMEILVPLADADDYEGAESIMAQLKIMASFDEDTGALTLFVAKILTTYTA